VGRGWVLCLPANPAFIYHDLARADSLQRIGVSTCSRALTWVLGLRLAQPIHFQIPLGVAVGQLPWFAGARIRATSQHSADNCATSITCMFSGLQCMDCWACGWLRKAAVALF
jgi:hypothetical protein